MTGTVVRLIGGGVATATAAHLLAADGFDVVSGGAAGPAAPVVMLSAPALGLLRDVFGQEAMFAGRPRISQRVVAWGGELASVAHEGIVVSGEALADGLRSSPACGRRDSRTSARPDPAQAGGEGVPQLRSKQNTLTLHAAPPFPESSLRHFGSRIALAAIAALAPQSDPHACHMEATPAGWLFLIPQGEGKAWLLAVGGAPDALLGHSRLIAAQVTALGPVTARFETAPRLLEVLGGDDWLALGTAAIAFDPICGDGTAQAVREAILAAAVIAGVRDGGDRAALVGHYRAMLLAAMRRHLQISLNFYATGGTSTWWREQVEALRSGYDWCTVCLGALPEPRFMLHGTRLVPRALAA